MEFKNMVEKNSTVEFDFEALLNQYDYKFQKGDLSMTLGNLDKAEPIAQGEEEIEQDDV